LRDIRPLAQAGHSACFSLRAGLNARHANQWLPIWSDHFFLNKITGRIHRFAAPTHQKERGLSAHEY
jgi:hypothetical protein